MLCLILYLKWASALTTMCDSYEIMYLLFCLSFCKAFSHYEKQKKEMIEKWK